MKKSCGGVTCRRPSTITKCCNGQRLGITNFLYILPSIITMYLQLIYNLVLVCLFLNTIFKFINVITLDLNKHMNWKLDLIFEEILECSTQFVVNGCDKNEFVPPALKDLCLKWDSCMNKEPVFLKTKASVEVFAEILNTFFDSITNRTIYCLLGLSFFSIIFLNIVLMTTLKK
jgi:hypothetical protein